MRKIYLAGPIDNATDDGIGFRREIIEKSNANGLNIEFIDPTNKPLGYAKEVGAEKQSISEMKKNKDWLSIQKKVNEFRKVDLYFVDMADEIIAYVDPDIHMCGTYNELFRAESQGKTRYLVIKGGKARCPNWLFDVFDLSNMYDSVDELIHALVEDSKKNLPLWEMKGT